MTIELFNEKGKVTAEMGRLCKEGYEKIVEDGDTIHDGDYIHDHRSCGDRVVEHRTVNRGDGGSIPPTAVNV